MLMSKTIGHVDDDGEFRQRIEFDLKRPWDMRIITKTGENPERRFLS
jgi:hypothetical protein